MIERISEQSHSAISTTTLRKNSLLNEDFEKPMKSLNHLNINLHFPTGIQGYAKFSNINYYHYLCRVGEFTIK